MRSYAVSSNFSSLLEKNSRRLALLKEYIEVYAGTNWNYREHGKTKGGKQVQGIVRE